MAEKDEAEGAIESLEHIWAIARSLRDAPRGIAQIVRGSVQMRAMYTTADVAAKVKLADNQIIKQMRMFREVGREQGIVGGIAGDRVMGLNAFGDS